MTDILSKTEQFFYEHAGWGYDPAKETSNEGRVRCAKELALAETWARENCYSFSWEYEQESPQSVFGKPCPKKGKCADAKCPYAHYDPKNEFFVAEIWDNSETPEVVGSLGMIEAPSKEYRRVVEAELAHEIMNRKDT